MSTVMPSIEDTYFQKGKRKAWFWATAGILAFLFIWEIISGIVNTFVLVWMTETHPAVIYISAGVYVLIITAAWLTILLAYGLNNRIKVFRSMFLILGMIQLPYACNQFVYSGFVFNILYSQGRISLAVSVIMLLTDIIRYVTWIVFLVIILCHSKSSRPLKTASIITLVYNVLSIAYSIGSPWFILSLSQRLDSVAMGLINGVASVFGGIITTGCLVYFFWAMSFSRMKKDAAEAVSQAI